MLEDCRRINLEQTRQAVAQFLEEAVEAGKLRVTDILNEGDLGLETLALEYCAGIKNGQMAGSRADIYSVLRWRTATTKNRGRTVFVAGRRVMREERQDTPAGTVLVLHANDAANVLKDYGIGVERVNLRADASYWQRVEELACGRQMDMQRRAAELMAGTHVGTGREERRKEARL